MSCSSDTDESVFVALNVLFSDSETVEPPPKRKKRFWVRNYFLDRDQTGGAQKHIVNRLQHFNDMQLFKVYLRMSAARSEELLNMVFPIILKENLTREPISASNRLAITLRYLASGDSQIGLGISYKCSATSVHRIIHETTKAISTVLKPGVFPVLNKKTFRAVAKGFSERWNFPNCLGAIDGKHVIIQAPKNSGSLYYNYKKSYSIVLLAICDDNYSFLMCDIGVAGRQSDGGIFRASIFGKKFFSNTLPLPEPCDVSNDFKEVPFVFVSDDAFALSEHMMKPYCKRSLSYKERIFNYRLSRARIVENAFGILSSRWRIFRTTINADVELVERIIEASVCLHNWLRQSDGNAFNNIVDREENGVIIPGSWRNEPSNMIPLQAQVAQNSSNASKGLRDRFANYFVGSGSVEWQNDYV